MAAPVKISLTKKPGAREQNLNPVVSLVYQSRATMVSQKGPTSRSVGHLGEYSRSAKKPTSSRKSGSVRSPDKKANLHQCYVCALEFKSESILNLHLEKVHLIGGAQNLVEKETKPQNVETPAEVNGEIFD